MKSDQGSMCVVVVGDSKGNRVLPPSLSPSLPPSRWGTVIGLGQVLGSWLDVTQLWELGLPRASTSTPHTARCTTPDPHSTPTL
jgi:hypothetical protein